MDSLKEVIESILFVAGEAVEFNDIASKLNITLEDVKNAVKELKEQREKDFSGIQIQVFNNKAQLCSNPNYAEAVKEVLNPIKEKALTKAVLEVAAIVAYKQPITRLEIEQVRGVNSDYAVNILIENNFIEVVGRKDAIGKPLLFGTTDIFLKRFNLESLEELPDYEDLLERIKIIKNPENTLFDFSNIPSSEKAIRDEENPEAEQEDNENEENVLALEAKTEEENELEYLQSAIDKDTINKFFNQIKSGDLEDIMESSETVTINNETEDQKELQPEEAALAPKLEVKKDDSELNQLLKTVHPELDEQSDLLDLI